MTFNQIIAFCPRCGHSRFPQKSPGFFQCEACDFHFYPNCSVAVVGIIVNAAGEILLIRRNREPGKNKWSVPGGFVDNGETAEGALAREVREEVGLEITDKEYLCSFPNPYEYKGVVFSVLDLVYVCRSNVETVTAAPDEVGEPTWLLPGAIDWDEVAFPSVRRALELFRQKATR